MIKSQFAIRSTRGITYSQFHIHWMCTDFVFVLLILHSPPAGISLARRRRMHWATGDGHFVWHRHWVLSLFYWYSWHVNQNVDNTKDHTIWRQHHTRTIWLVRILWGAGDIPTNHWEFNFCNFAFLSQIFPEISRLCCQHLDLRALHLWRARWHGGAQNSCTMVSNCNLETRISNWKSKFSFRLCKRHTWSSEQWTLNQLAYRHRDGDMGDSIRWTWDLTAWRIRQV